MLHTQFSLMTLRAIWAIHESGSALKAARIVHRSQPAITTALAGFERQLQRPLFVRNARGMSPTPDGKVLCARVALALAHLRNAETYLATRRNPRTALPFHRLVHETQLAALTALLKTGSFSAAARQLQRAEPSVHRSLRELETLCGIRLWERYGSGIEPTPEARELARHGELCWSELAAGLDEMAEQHGIMNGRVSIGSLPLTRSRWLPDAVTRLVSLHPHAQVVIVDGAYGELLRGLRHGQIDFVLGALREVKPARDIVQTQHFEDQLAIIVRAGHPLAAGFDSSSDKLSPGQLAGLSWILPRVDTPARRRFADFLNFKGVPWPDRAIECSSLVATRALLLQSDHAALLSVRQIGIELETGLLTVLGPPLTGTTRAIGITTREGYRPTALQQKLLDLLKASAGQL
ncbi:MAG: LysR family transcriptional regulator [Hyphomicrobiales bacterium]|nr:LysR family transcriptional regulator [Hyphomicrobiales bacterium]